MLNSIFVRKILTEAITVFLSSASTLICAVETDLSKSAADKLVL